MSAKVAVKNILKVPKIVKMEIENLYNKNPFSIKKGYEDLWYSLSIFSQQKVRIPESGNLWSFPEERKQLILSEKKKGEEFLTFSSPSQKSSCLSILSGKILKTYNCSLHYRIRICSKFLSFSVYTPSSANSLKVLRDLKGKPLVFHKKKSVFFEIQGVSEFLISSSEKLDFEIECLSPIPQKNFDSKVCLSNSNSSIFLFQVFSSNHYKYCVPSKAFAEFFNSYERYYPERDYSFPENEKTNFFEEERGFGLSLSLRNVSSRKGSYLFIPEVRGKGATYDSGGFYIGIEIPRNKTAVLSFRKIEVIKEKEEYFDEGDWKFFVETGSIQKLIQQSSYQLERKDFGYSLPEIRIENLRSFTFSIVNIGSASGIVRFVPTDWKIEFI